MKPRSAPQQPAPASGPPAADLAGGPAAGQGHQRTVGEGPAAASSPADAWADAQIATVLLAVHPQGLGGARVQGPPGPARDRWLQDLRHALPATSPWQRLPLRTDDDGLLGGLDLGATLQRGSIVLQLGLLARTDGGVLLVPMAERMNPVLAAKLASVLDAGCVSAQRAGHAVSMPARLAVVALDEGQGGSPGLDAGAEHEAPPAALLERLGLCVNLHALQASDRFFRSVPETTAGSAALPTHAAAAVLAARQRLPGVCCDVAIVQALCEAALALGVHGLRASLFAVAAARAHAAWNGRDEVTVADAAVAARLVLAPRATQWPSAPEAEVSPNAQPPEPTPLAEDDTAAPKPDAGSHGQPERPPPSPSPQDLPQEVNVPPPAETPTVQDQLVQAAQAAIPQGLLALLAGAAGRAPAGAGAGGRAGALQASRLRGRPYGSRRGDPRNGARLHVIDTLRAAAPWQPLRRREWEAAAVQHAPPSALQPAGRAGGQPTAAPPRPAVLVRREDFHISRFRQRRETTTLFVVDASGSAALHRLAEAKGAVELLLADCYVRRDRVALMAFRGPAGAELLLPPTRSLVRAKRSLAAMAGGGGTPLAAALDHALELTQGIARNGGTPLAVFLTDGRANIARDGSPGRERAMADAMAVARLWLASGLGALWIDTAPQPQAQARQMALAMGARYLPLPLADARQVSEAVTALR